MAERLLARKLARELTSDEIKAVAGADDPDPRFSFVCEWVYIGGGRQDEKVYQAD